MIDSNNIALMREMVSLQQARAANWPTANAPADPDLEARHQVRLAEIRETLSALRPDAEGTSEAPSDVESDRGVCPTSEGNLLRRIWRRIFRRND